jgi:hypothetical protein
MRAAVTLAFMLMAAAPATAQQPIDNASDQELLAAYCTAALRTSRAAIDGDKRVRFQAYLASRGFFAGRRSYSATNGINVAAERGAKDDRDCSSRITFCLDHCRTQRQMGMTCDGPCIEGAAACSRVVRCATADRQLPF